MQPIRLPRLSGGSGRREIPFSRAEFHGGRPRAHNDVAAADSGGQTAGRGLKKSATTVMTVSGAMMLSISHENTGSASLAVELKIK